VTVVSEIGLPPTLLTVEELETEAGLPASFRVSLVIASVNTDVVPVNFDFGDGVPVAIAVRLLNTYAAKMAAATAAGQR